MGTPILKLVKGVDRLERVNRVEFPTFDGVDDEDLWNANGTNSYIYHDSSEWLPGVADQCLRVEYNGASASTLYHNGSSTLIVAPEYGPHICSCYIKFHPDYSGTGLVEMRFDNYSGSDGGETIKADPAISGWQRMSAVRFIGEFDLDTADFSGSINLHINAPLPSNGDVFWVTGFMAHPGDKVTPYFDGSFPGARWLEGPNRSQSVIDARSKKEINLLNSNGFHVTSVSTGISSYKGGGIWRSTALSEGRRIVGVQRSTVFETYTLTLAANSANILARRLQELRTMLLQAADYWRNNFDDDPVWLEARASCENNSRYAPIINAIIPADNNHFSQPFMHVGGGAVMTELELIIERLPWQDNPVQANLWPVSSAGIYYVDFYGGTKSGSKWVGTQDELGEIQELTRKHEVFVGNRSHTSVISHVYTHDINLASFSSNLLAVDQSTRYSLMPDPLGDGDSLYVGSTTGITGVDGSTFCNMVFNIETPARYTGLGTIDWYYWDGATWTAITEADMSDRTRNFRTKLSRDQGSFELGGTNTITWLPASDWATTTINSITGYWIRGQVNTTSGSATVPYQIDRPIYTSNKNYVEVAEDEIGGDMPALIKLTFSSDSSTELAGSGETRVNTLTKGAANRVMVGSRRVDRGEAFESVINLGNFNNPTGITVAAGNNASISTATNKSPSSKLMACTSTSTHNERFTITLDQSIAWQYKGRFRAICRFYHTNAGGSGDITSELQYRAGTNASTITTDSARVSFTTTGGPWFSYLDYGIVDFTLSGPALDEIEIEVHADGLTAWDAYDFWLLPTDEMFIDTGDPLDAATAQLQGNLDLIIDATNPKGVTSRVEESGETLTSLVQVRSGSPSLTPGVRQRIHVLQISESATSTRPQSFFWGSLSVRLEIVQRWNGLRGDE